MIKRITVNGASVEYRTAGNGKPLVLLHGFGFDRHVWQPLLPLLEPRYRLIIPDLPGSGASGVPSGAASMDAMANAVAQILAEEKIMSCTLVGHSMGGYVALALTEHHPMLVQRLCLFHSHPFADDDARKEKRDKDIDFVQRNGSAAYIKLLVPGLFSYTYKSQHDSVVRGLVERYQLSSPEGLIYSLQAMKQRPDRTHVLEALTQPLLLIAGLHDTVVTPEMVTRMSRFPMHTHALLLRDAAHMGMFEAPQACVENFI